MDEKRRFTRRIVTANVMLQHDMFGEISATTYDISDSGVFIELDVSPPVNVGDTLRLSFLDSAQPDTIFYSRLVRITEKGWGLNFIDCEVNGVRKQIDELRAEFQSKRRLSR